MTIREEIEAREQEILAPWASHSVDSKGRLREEERDDIRPVYQRDRDRILHSKSFRRLKDKTQVFIVPDGDHYRTRMTHTLEVSQIARTIARALRLNEDLTEAVALGHDLGHTPFGHAGERVLNRVCPEGFRHNEQSLRTVDVLEKDGRGLNLTREVRDGILNHQMSLMPSTLEGQIVRLSDKIAYLHHDCDDAIRGGILTEESVPAQITDVLPEIRMSEETETAFRRYRQFMFEAVYTNPEAKGEEHKAELLVERLYDHYLEHLDVLPRYMLSRLDEGDSRERVVCDYISVRRLGIADAEVLGEVFCIIRMRLWNRCGPAMTSSMLWASTSN